jgi:transcriptional regulator with XRE-family HTH domain
MSLKEVAEHIVIDVSILSKIEHGDQPYLKESLERYLEAK